MEARAIKVFVSANSKQMGLFSTGWFVAKICSGEKMES